MRVLLLTLALCFASSLAAQDQADKKEAKKDEKKKEDKKGDKKGEKKDDKKKDDKSFDFPLKVGSKWTYRVGENRYEVKVAKIEPVGKVECARMETTINGKAASFEHVAVGSDKGVPAVMRYSFEGKKAVPPLPFLLLPADKTSWRVESKVLDQTLKGTFKKSFEDVKVPAGAFPKAAKVSSDLSVNKVDLSVTWWFASGWAWSSRKPSSRGSASPSSWRSSSRASEGAQPQRASTSSGRASRQPCMPRNHVICRLANCRLRAWTRARACARVARPSSQGNSSL